MTIDRDSLIAEMDRLHGRAIDDAKEASRREDEAVRASGGLCGASMRAQSDYARARGIKLAMELLSDRLGVELSRDWHAKGGA